MEILGTILFVLWLIGGPMALLWAFVELGQRQQRNLDAKKVFLVSGIITVVGSPVVYWFWP